VTHNHGRQRPAEHSNEADASAVSLNRREFFKEPAQRASLPPRLPCAFHLVTHSRRLPTYSGADHLTWATTRRAP